jgi:hypothetical protein
MMRLSLLRLPLRPFFSGAACFGGSDQEWSKLIERGVADIFFPLHFCITIVRKSVSDLKFLVLKSARHCAFTRRRAHEKIT